MSRQLPASDRRWSEADARVLLADWQRSGLPMAAFARRHGFNAQRLAWWRKRLSDSLRQASLVPAGAFVPATIIDAPRPSAGATARVRLPRGVVVELTEVTAAWVASLAAALDALP
jgi:hypothetical protein